MFFIILSLSGSAALLAVLSTVALVASATGAWTRATWVEGRVVRVGEVGRASFPLAGSVWTIRYDGPLRDTCLVMVLPQGEAPPRATASRDWAALIGAAAFLAFIALWVSIPIAMSAQAGLELLGRGVTTTGVISSVRIDHDPASDSVAWVATIRFVASGGRVVEIEHEFDSMVPHLGHRLPVTYDRTQPRRARLGALVPMWREWIGAVAGLLAAIASSILALETGAPPRAERLGAPRAAGSES